MSVLAHWNRNNVFVLPECSWRIRQLKLRSHNWDSKEGTGKPGFRKLTGLSTDQASVTVGENNRVAAKLRESNDKLLHIHWVCHCLALACTDSCHGLKFIKEEEDLLRQLWCYFRNSPKKTQLLWRRCRPGLIPLPIFQVAWSLADAGKQLVALLANYVDALTSNIKDP